MSDENNVVTNEDELNEEQTSVEESGEAGTEAGDAGTVVTGDGGTPAPSADEYDQDEEEEVDPLDVIIPPDSQYLATFQDLKDYEDLYEERTSSIVSGIHFNTLREMQPYIENEGYELITVEEQNALVAGGVRRKSDGAIVERPPVIIPLADKIKMLLDKIDNHTKEQITGGFIFEVTSGNPTGRGKFDSTEEDQMTFSTMYAASKSPDFADHPVYHGFIPMRGYPVDINDNVSETKTVYYLNADNMQRFSDSLALHIGSCKTAGWQLQSIAKSATDETYDAIEAQIYEAIGYVDPNA